MKILRLPIFLFVVSIIPAAFSQQNGTVEGRLVNRTDPSIIARGVELEVIELSMGMSIIKTAITDASGRFRIGQLPQNRRLMIRANYQGTNYYSQFDLGSSGTASVDIEVFESTDSLKDIKVDNMRMTFQMEGDQIISLETATIRNNTSPPRTYMNSGGNYHISKPAGIVELPQIRVTAPGSSMPVIQPALESADGQSYYSLYPVRPGITTFEVQLKLPYATRQDTYNKKFYMDIGSIDIVVTPQDMLLSGSGLSRIQTESQANIALYASAPIKAGSEVEWTFSGGTPVVSKTESSETRNQSSVEAMPGPIGRNALIIGPLLLLGFILVLWSAFNHSQKGSQKAGKPHIRQLKELREQLLNTTADLDHRYEKQLISRQDFLKKREENKRRLRRISLLLKKR